MSAAEVRPQPLGGTIAAVSSKSDAHRMLICAALSDAPTRLLFRGLSEDISATARCLTALGAAVEFDETGCLVTPVQNPPALPVLDCGESGSTLRFLLPVAAALCGQSRFTGGGRLPERPVTELLSALEIGGVETQNRRLPIALKGRLHSGIYTLPGNVSSQYISGLLLGLAICPGYSRIRLSSSLESAPYVDMTLCALERFGVSVARETDGWCVQGVSRLTSPKIAAVEGDWSNAAFFLAAGAIGGRVTVTGLDVQSPQGDKAVLEVLRRMGADCTVTKAGVSVTASPLRGVDIDLAHIPDLLPILAVTAAFAKGKTRFYNAARLRLKESDRLSAAAKLLTSLGVTVDEQPDALVVFGGNPLSGAAVDGFGDHRMVMAAAVGGAFASAPVQISGAEAVSKSYPAFFADFEKLGGMAHVV